MLVSTTIGRWPATSPGLADQPGCPPGAAPGRDDAALVEEVVGDRDGLVEQAARIVAQVEDQPAQPPPGFGAQRLASLAQAWFGLLGELADPDHADVALELACHGLHVDDLPGQRERSGWFWPGALDGQLQPRVWRAAHLVDRVVEAEP